MESSCNGLILAKYRRQTADLGTERSSNMLGSIRYEIFYARHDLVEQCLPVKQSTKA